MPILRGLADGEAGAAKGGAQVKEFPRVSNRSDERRVHAILRDLRMERLGRRRAALRSESFREYSSAWWVRAEQQNAPPLAGLPCRPAVIHVDLGSIVHLC